MQSYHETIQIIDSNTAHVIIPGRPSPVILRTDTGCIQELVHSWITCNGTNVFTEVRGMDSLDEDTVIIDPNALQGVI